MRKTRGEDGPPNPGWLAEGGKPGAAGAATSYDPGTYTANDVGFILGGGSITVGGGEEEVPEPATIALLATGLAGLGAAVRRRRRA